jgi:hypothetical protein
MTTAGDNITTANIVASMQALATTYNAGITWHAGNNPFQNTAIPLAGGDSSGYPTIYGNPISDTNVTASTLVTNFRAYATQLSRIRNTRLLKWYQIQGDVRASLSSDQSNITSLNSDFQINVDNIVGPSTGNTIDASDLDDFVGALSTAINASRTNTVTVEEFYCHSNCHGSCHGSI